MYDVKDKELNLKQYNTLTLNKTLSMFEWENLPESLPYNELERRLQTNGWAFVTEVEGNLYTFTGGLGGVPDVYGRPTTITISNPALNFYKTLDVEKDGVLIKNDDEKMGLLPIFNRFNTSLVENDISMKMVLINSRMQTLISASDDKTKASAELYLKKLLEGEMSVIGEAALFDGVEVHQNSGQSGGNITSLIEHHQYVKATLHNELGLNSNFNMKRERLVSDEINAVEDTLYPLIDNMMKCRLKAVEKINEMFNTDIRVDYGSIWSKKNKDVVDDTIEADTNVEESPVVDDQSIYDDDPDGSITSDDNDAQDELESDPDGDIYDPEEQAGNDNIDSMTQEELDQYLVDQVFEFNELIDSSQDEDEKQRLEESRDSLLESLTGAQYELLMYLQSNQEDDQDEA